VTQYGVGGGPVSNQHVWDGQGLKDPCFCETFKNKKNDKEKFIL
jgi:hypothetical protein